MTTPNPAGPITAEQYDAYRVADAGDRRLAATLAIQVTDALAGFEQRAQRIYAWLRERPTVAPHQLVITPGTPTMKEQRSDKPPA